MTYRFAEAPGAGPDAPVLLLLHGTGGDENQFLGLGRQLLPEARLVAPRGDVSENGALRFFRRAGEGVYDMADLRRATGKLAGFIDGLGAAGPVYGLGYSNGANILAAVLLERPELLAGAALMHPLIPWEPAPQPGLAGKALLVSAGRNDPLCPAPRTEALMDYFEAQGAAVGRFWHQGGHEVTRAELVAVKEFFDKL